jgi:hypothetical protein
MRKPAAEQTEDEEYDYYEEPGTVCLWEWLESGRFFPSEESLYDVAGVTGQGIKLRTFMRGCASVSRCVTSVTPADLNTPGLPGVM